MIRDNTDCPYCHDIFDQYCNLFKGYKNCDKNDCEVLKTLKENAELKKQQFSLRNERNTFLAQNEQYEKDLIDFNENLTEAKEIMQKLIANAPDTYSGTNIELQQKKMFSFQDAVNKAEQFLNNEVKE
jgi:hypothetical protein